MFWPIVSRGLQHQPRLFLVLLPISFTTPLYSEHKKSSFLVWIFIFSVPARKIFIVIYTKEKYSEGEDKRDKKKKNGNYLTIKMHFTNILLSRISLFHIK
jgi:hypothetical protein